MPGVFEKLPLIVSRMGKGQLVCPAAYGLSSALMALKSRCRNGCFHIIIPLPECEMETTGGSRPGLCVRCAKSTHWWSDPHTGGLIRTLQSLGAAPLRRLTTARSGALLLSPDRGHQVVARSPDLAIWPTEGLRPRARRETYGPADGGVWRPAPNRQLEIRKLFPARSLAPCCPRPIEGPGKCPNPRGCFNCMLCYNDALG